MATKISSIKQFLASQFVKANKANHPSKANTLHLFVGNEAADADSIVSSICSAYIRGIRESDENTVYLPVVAVPRCDLPLRRDVEILINKGDLCWDDVPTLEDVKLKDIHRVLVTLTDHNVPQHPLLQTMAGHPFEVVEIIDHHIDGNQFPQLAMDKRRIEFDATRNQALVASTCTLLWEDMVAHNLSHLTDAALLLAGVILLDTANFNSVMKKATVRDVKAMAELKELLHLEPNELFELLNHAKTDLNYWRSLSILNALKFDYKLFPVDKTNRRLGMSSILMPVEDLIHRVDFSETVAKFLATNQLDVLAIMSIYNSPATGQLTRELVILGKDVQVVEEVVAALLHLDQRCDSGALNLRRLDVLSECRGGKLPIVCFQQGKLECSRKQVAPILTQILDGLVA